MIVYGYDKGDVVFYDHRDSPYPMISYDENYVYVDSEAFENYLHEKNAEGEIYIVFGGFHKLPGVGGLGYSCQ